MALMWDWGGANSFDMVTGSTRNMHFPYALNSDSGELSYMYKYASTI